MEPNPTPIYTYPKKPPEKSQESIYSFNQQKNDLSNLKERDSDTYKKNFDIFSLNEQEEAQYEEIYARFVETPLSALSYSGSVLGDANLVTKEIRVGKELDPFTKEMVKTHEKLHIKHPRLDELAIRIKTVEELEMKGKYIEAEIGKRFVLMMAGMYRYN